MTMTLHGELARRARASRERLRAAEYRAPRVFEEGDDWPGDWQGHTLLALLSLYRVLGDESALRQAEEILAEIRARTNRFHYFGPVIDGTTANEQQVSGNNWYLRALCEYALLTGDEAVRGWIDDVVTGLILPCAPLFARYPRGKRAVGEVSGSTLAEAVDGWELSTDSGCAFILLDGAAQALALTGREDLRAAVETMIKAFLSVDPAAEGWQTHATLSALYGVLRAFRVTKDPRLLEAVRRGFDVYLEQGATVNYANCNWFGRPDTWTEPCAVVDSAALAAGLYETTGEVRYAVLLNRIWKNALRSGQRGNGGAGCDLCLAGDNDLLKMYAYEAYFCCTMRVCEGWRRLFDALVVPGDPVRMLWADDVNYAGPGAEFSLRVERGRIERLTFRFVKAPQELDLYVPEAAVVRVTGAQARREGLLVLTELGREVTVELDKPVRPEIRLGREVLFCGDELLTVKTAADWERPDFTVERGNRRYSPVLSFLDAGTPAEEAAAEQRL